MMTSRSLSLFSTPRTVLAMTGIVLALAVSGPALADTEDDVVALRRQVADLEVRLSAMEEQLRQQNGGIQDAAHQADAVDQKLKAFSDDVEFRLQRLEQASGVMAGGAVPPAAPASPGKPPKTPPAAAAPPPPAAHTEADSATPANSSGTSLAAYNAAFGLLRKGDYDSAETALKGFMQSYPQDKLVGNAQYWLGETYYVRGKYDQAAQTFLSNVKTYGKGAKGADSFLKLGMSLVQMGQKEKGCQVLADLPNRYSDANSTIKQRADQERKNAGCS